MINNKILVETGKELDNLVVTKTIVFIKEKYSVF